MPLHQKIFSLLGIFFATLTYITMKKPERVLFASLGAALLSGVLLLPTQSSGQSNIPPAPKTLASAARPAPAAVAAEDPATLALAAEVLQQQAKIVENQKLIDDKLAAIAENLRIARIYVSRAK